MVPRVPAAMTDRPIARWHVHIGSNPIRRNQMLKRTGWVSAAVTLTAFSILASISLGAGPSEAAVVYCRTVGIPKGCVVRPGVPVAAATVGVAGVGVGAPGVGVRAGTPLNRGGPVNRVGRR
jgi:hypothetical protein